MVYSFLECCTETPDFIAYDVLAAAWPCSADVNPVDYRLWGVAENRSKISDVNHSRDRAWLKN